MAKHWAIAIGINHYQNFQSLQYARHDAEAMQQFLLNSAGVPPEQCLLLTETAPDYQNRPMVPDRETLFIWLEWLCNTALQPDDVLWVFFSGYGIYHDQEDYLMPWDAAPQRLTQTGLTLRSLLHLLHGAPTPQIWLMLDMNRSQGVLSGTLPGQQTQELAKQFGISTLFSCQPQQFSYETTELRQGLFTVALLEGLRLHQSKTLGEIDAYLNDRLPELCNHHWRPSQNPICVGSSQLQLYPVRQESLNPALAANTSAVVGARHKNGRQSSVGLRSQHQMANSSVSNFSDLPATQRDVANNSLGENGQVQGSIPLRSTPYSADQPLPVEDRVGILRLGLWFIMAIFAFLVGFRIWQTYLSRNAEQTQPGSVASSLNRTSPPGASPSANGNNSTTDSSSQSPTQDVESNTGSSPGPEDSASQSVTQSTAQPPEPATQTFAPESTQAPNNGSGRAAVEPELLKVQNQRILLGARAMFQDGQASQFSQAIEQVRKIQPGEPFYEQAQQDMNRWSQVIFDLAMGRAEERNYAGAIAAASLVPSDRANYDRAQQAIAYWQNRAQQEQANQARLSQARSLIRFDSASSYNQAINLAKEIPEGQPLFFEAQRLIGEWSGQILAVAENRASLGSYQDAIMAAELIPSEMPHYEVAQARVREWQGR